MVMMNDEFKKAMSVQSRVVQLILCRANTNKCPVNAGHSASLRNKSEFYRQEIVIIIIKFQQYMLVNNLLNKIYISNTEK